jgi:hypothetical protein
LPIGTVAGPLLFIRQFEPRSLQKYSRRAVPSVETRGYIVSGMLSDVSSHPESYRRRPAVTTRWRKVA